MVATSPPLGGDHLELAPRPLSTAPVPTIREHENMELYREELHHDHPRQ